MNKGETMCNELEKRDKPVEAYANCPITPEGVTRIFTKMEEMQVNMEEIQTKLNALTTQNAMMLELQGIRNSIVDLTKSIGQREAEVTSLIKWRDLHDKASSPESLDVLKVKNSIWMDRFKMGVGSMLLCLVIASTIWVPEMREVNLINGLGFGIAAFIFGENIINRYKSNGPKA